MSGQLQNKIVYGAMSITVNRVIIDQIESMKELLEQFRELYLEFQWLSNKVLTLSWRRPLSYRNQSIESMDGFLYDNGPRHERVNEKTIHQRYINSLINEIFKYLNGRSPDLMNEVFRLKLNYHNLLELSPDSKLNSEFKKQIIIKPKCL